jgi:hypothetical protein
MTNFILKHRQTTEPDIKKMTAILNAHGVKLLDGSLLPKTALVEIEESCLERLQTDLGTEWNVYPEKKYRVPETNKKNKKDSL